MAENSYRVLIVDDDRELRTTIGEFLEENQYSVEHAASARQCHEVIRKFHPDLILMDYSLPDSDGLQLIKEIAAAERECSIIMLTGHGTVDLAVRAIQEGADNFICKPVELPFVLRMVEKSLGVRQAERKNLAGKICGSRYRRNPFLGQTNAIRRLEESVQRVLDNDCPILIQGETGSGKGVLAEWIHSNSQRKKENFVDLNCAGLNRELLESELFGHERGAFTGAVSAKPGLLEVGHRGTLFLDEIGDMDIAIQPRLLKVVEEKRFRRLGEIRERNVDIRLIAATHQDLAALVEEKRFRSDLFFRVNTITLRIPPLRERVEDIPVLAEWFLGFLRDDLSMTDLRFEDGVPELLQAYHWPGNIRELRNVLERAALLAQGRVICQENLGLQPRRAQPTPASSTPHAANSTLDEIVRWHIAETLLQENGNVDKAASRLGIPRSTLYTKIKQYALNKNQHSVQ
jgi:DNA-binding NtrC family response regulator